jgi:ATP-dependent exoDNAse (exonuclease V) beta subunit
MFINDLIELPQLVRIDGEQRFYQTPDGNKYPSVTTVLSEMSDKTAILKWRKRVGEEEANRVSGRATRRGTAVHTLLEKFVLNEEIDFSDTMPLNKTMYNQIAKYLQQNVDNVRSSEGQLFSHKLKIAGSVDLIASYKGEPAIIDFKTSTKPKRKEWIENYFLQATMYSYMLYEMTGLYHPKLVIMIALEEDSGPQIFEEHASNWIEKATKMCREFHAR